MIICTIILCCCFWAFPLLGTIDIVLLFVIPLFMLVLGFLAYQVAAATDSYKYIKNSQSNTEFFDNISKAIESPPTCTMEVKSYYYERRGKGGRGRKEKVVTDEAEQQFVFEGWVDRSTSAKAIDYLQSFSAIRLNIDKIVEMSPEAQKRYQEEKKAFIEDKKTEEFYDFVLHVEVPHTTDWTLVYQADKKPWYANSCLHTFLNILILGWI